MFAWVQLALHIIQIIGKVLDLWREQDKKKVESKTEALTDAIKATGESDARGITLALDRYNSIK